MPSNPAGDATVELAAVLAAVAAAASKGPAALAGAIKALASEGLAREVPGQALPENHIEIDGDAGGVSNPKGHDAMKIYGPYPHKRKWRLLIRNGSQQEARSFDTEAEAKVALRKLRIQAHKQAGIPVGKAIDAYAEQLRRNGLKEKVDRHDPLSVTQTLRARSPGSAAHGDARAREGSLHEAGRLGGHSAKHPQPSEDVLPEGEGERVD